MRVIQTYFDAFHRGDVDGMPVCLSDDVVHHVNEGQIRVGRDAFAAFSAHINRCYKEELADIVIFGAEVGTRAAVRYMINGTYLATDEGLPEDRGQT